MLARVVGVGVAGLEDEVGDLAREERQCCPVPLATSKTRAAVGKAEKTG